MRKLVESGQYFRESKIWYEEIFLLPFIQRSWVVLSASIVFSSAVLLLFVINSLYPLNKQIMYAIFVEDASEYSAKIEPASYFEDDTYKSVAKIFLETYVEIREGYKYEDLANRMLYVQNTSTKVVFNRYNDYLSLENPQSPVLRLQRYANRFVEVYDIRFLSYDKAILKFVARSIEDSGKVIEENNWEAEFSFVIDKIDLKMAENTPFNFIVSDYKVKLIKDNNAK